MTKAKVHMKSSSVPSPPKSLDSSAYNTIVRQIIEENPRLTDNHDKI